MTVGELIKQLKQFDENLPVCVRRKTVIVEDRPYSENFTIIEPALSMNSHDRWMFIHCDEHGGCVVHDGELYHGTDEVQFSVDSDSKITVESRYADAVLAIGEFNGSVFDNNAPMEFDDENGGKPCQYKDDADIPRKFYKELVLID